MLASSILALLVTAPAASSVPQGASLRFEHLTIADGLAQNTVTDVLQDDDGFLWFATENGLHRYDGYRFVIFQHDAQRADSLSGNYVTDLFTRADGTLLVATGSAGLNAFDPRSATFRRFAKASALSHERVWSVVEDRLGNVWAATDAGLDRIAANGEITRFRYDPEDLDGLASDVVRQLLVDRSGQLWIGSFGGLNVLDEGSDQIRRFRLEPDTDVSLADVNVTALYEDSAGALWVGAAEHVVRINAARTSVDLLDRAPTRSARFYSLVSGFAEDGRGNLWIATLGDGAERLRAGTTQTERFAHVPADSSSLGDSAINVIFRDATNVMWFGTESAGVSKLNPAIEAFAHYRRSLAEPDSLPSNIVWSMYEDLDGSVWVATEAGLSRLDAATGTYRHYLMRAGRGDTDDSRNLVYYVHRDAAGTLWAGTGEGLYRFDPVSEDFLPVFAFDDDSVAEYAPVVHIIREDAEGMLWLGSFNGLVRFDPATSESRVWRRERGEIGDNWVMDIADAGDGTLWIGSEGGLARVDQRSGKLLTVFGPNADGRDGLSHSAVQSLAIDTRGGVWVGTVSGLQRLEPATGEFTRYGVADGLPSDYIYAVLIDQADTVWVSTNRGIARLDANSGAFDSFDVSDGLQSNEFNTGAAHLGSSGKVYFGGINGFNAFDPETIQTATMQPRVALTAARVLGRNWRDASAHEMRNGLVLTSAETVFALDFAAFDYKAPAGNRFLFRLDGFDGDWRDAGDSHSVSYTNLDPGEYRFLLRGLSSDGVWSKDEAVLPITVEPPVWATWYAKAVYLLLAIGLTLLALRMWTTRLRREHLLTEELERRVLAERLQQFSEDLYATLNAAVMADRTVAAARDLVGFDVAAHYRRGEDRFVLERTWPADARQPLPSGLTDARGDWPEWMAASRPVIVPVNALADSAAGTSAALLIVPWATDRSASGALALWRPNGPEYGSQDARLASALVNQARVGFENARLFAEVQQLALTDDLTGLNNRRHFTELAQREFSRSARYGTPLSVIMLDADNFKSINDTHGHQVGDQVLKRVASICHEAIREFDIVGRYGGEEFIVMLPETDADVAAIVAERMRRDVAATRIRPVGVTAVQITISAGVAQRTQATADLLHLIGQADKALYAAKERGRNRTVVIDGLQFDEVGT